MQSQRTCNYYKQYGSCKFHDKCRYKHITNILSIPLDLFKIIMTDQYLSDVRQVCRVLRKIVDENYPLQLFVFTRVMNGCYTTGCAMAIARNFNDAIFQISIRSLNPCISPKCSYGTWSPHDAECYSSFQIEKWSDVENNRFKNSSFKQFYHKFNNLIYQPKCKINSISPTEINITQYRPKHYSNDVKIECFNIYFELMSKQNKSLNIFPLDKSMGFYNGGGS